MMPYNIAVLGPVSVGKTTLCKKLTFDDGEVPQASTRPTYLSIQHPTEEAGMVNLVFADLPGHIKYQRLWPGQQKAADALMLCYDASRPASIKALEILSLKAGIDLSHETRPILLVGTKSDLVAKSQADFALDFIQRYQIKHHYVVNHQASGYKSLERIENDCIALAKTKPKRRTMIHRLHVSFPAQYQKLWRQAQHAEVIDNDYSLHCIRAILDDYTKGYSCWALFWSGHWNRHHLSAVNEIVVGIDNGTYINKEAVISKLDAIDKKEGGSLSRRLKFIKNKLGVQSKSKEHKPRGCFGLS